MMRIDPTLLTEDGDFNQLEPDLSGIDPALVQLSESMARAQDEGFHDSSHDLTSQEESSLTCVPDERPGGVEDILADFMEEHTDFKSKYQRASLAKSTIMAVLEEEADQLRAVFGPKTDKKAKRASPRISPFLHDLATLMSLVPALPPEDEPDTLFESLVSPLNSQHVKLVDLIAKKKYSKRARVKRIVQVETPQEVDLEIVEARENSVPDLERAGTFPLHSPLLEADSGLPIGLDVLEAVVLDYQAAPDSPSSSAGPSKRSRGRPKGSLNKTHVPAWQTKENRRIRQKERRELYRSQRIEEAERRRREDPSYISPKRRVGRPRKMRDAMGELLAGAGVTEDGVRMSMMEEQQLQQQQQEQEHMLDSSEMQGLHEDGMQTALHEHVEMDHLDMSTGMGLDMAAMGLDFPSDPGEFGHAHLSHGHSEDHQTHHQHDEGDHQVVHDLMHDHHHEHVHHHPQESDHEISVGTMHTHEGVMQMLDMPTGMGDMAVGVEEETNYLTYGAETYAYTLDAIERAHAAVREEEERNGMQQ